jgi:predicted pyridoxine 5'-phosphate oxidase superfamily flavin-nucleotide-binding protein
MASRDLFHADERAAQQLAGYARTGGAIHEALTAQHRDFFERLAYVFAGVLDDHGWPLAAILTGSPGFVRSPDPKTLVVRAQLPAADPAAPALQAPRDVALLGIDLATRRRNRANGAIIASDAQGFAMRVQQSFGNCPQYIQRRTSEALARRPGPLVVARSLDETARTLIESADTFFVASRSRPDIEEAGRVDISHRGGKAGFVAIDAQGSLVIPDYRGNRYFNTLGNLHGDPRAALLFIDFDRGDSLQLQGRVTIDWTGRSGAGDAERLWRFEPTASWRRPAAVPIAWHFVDHSPVRP